MANKFKNFDSGEHKKIQTEKFIKESPLKKALGPDVFLTRKDRDPKKRNVAKFNVPWEQKLAQIQASFKVKLI